VRFASYAPLLGKIGRTGWDPNLIYFTNTRVAPTINYHVQRLFSTNAGDAYVQTTVTHDDVHTPKPSFGYGTFLGTWGTEAEFDQVRVATGKDVHLQDSFDTSPANWRPDGGAWQVVDGAYRQTFDDARPALSRVATQLPAGDQKLTLRARKTGGAEGFLIGFSMVDSENYYWWNLGGWGNSRHAVEKLTGGAGGEKTIVGKPVDGRIESNRWYDITIERVGRRIRCSLDGSLVHEFEDEGFRPVDVLAVSTVRDTKSGDVILKMVNTAPTPKPVQIELAGGGGAGEDRTATRTVLAGDPLATNGIDAPRPLLPTTSAIRIRGSSAHELPAHSLTVIRINGGGGGDAK
jgi:alpha-L-arabinofuranosidase